jgi:hypothetical protein
VRVAAAGTEITVDEGTTGARVDAGVAGKRVGVTGTISAVGEGEGVGVLDGMRYAVGSDTVVGVESGETTVMVARGDTGRVTVGNATTWPGVAVAIGLTGRVAVSNGMTEADGIGLGLGITAHPASVTPSKIKMIRRKICDFIRPACTGSKPCPPARALSLLCPPAVPSPAG